MKNFQRILMVLFRSRLAGHVIFCAVFIILFFIPVLGNKKPIQVIDRAITICFFFILITYTGRWCCRRWLLKMKLIPFVTSMVIITILYATLVGSYIYLVNLQGGFEAFLWGIPLVILFLALGVFLTLSKEGLRRQLLDLEISDQQKQSELALLKAQLSPHFLFNTLNNLYGISLNRPEKIPSLLVKLSDLLRYSVYETKEKFVPLNEEVAYIWNYIELEKIRMADRLQLNLEIEQNISAEVRISPMILIVFVENAFKHAKNTFDDVIRIDISLKVFEEKIIFSACNSVDYDEWLRQQIEKGTGIGLATTVRRLDLLYPGEYKLEQKMENNKYFMNLELKVRL